MGYSAGPGQIVPMGYSAGPGQIVPMSYSARPGQIVPMGYSAGPGQIVPMGYSARPGQIVPMGYSTGHGQIVAGLFSRTRLNSYDALICYLTRPKIFMLKYLRNFYLFSFIWYWVLLLRVYTFIFFFLYMILICAVLENMVSKGLCAFVKTWITRWSWSVLLATDSNSTVLHFDSLNKPDLSCSAGPADQLLFNP